MAIYVGISIIIISYVVLKYYQFRSFKYLKDEYEYVKLSFLFHGTHYSKKIYANPEGIRLNKIGTILFLIIGLVGIIVMAFFS